LQNFLVKNGVELLNSEAVAIFKRLDIDRDNRISFWEFNRIFTLTASGSKPSNPLSSSIINQSRKEIVQATTNSFYKGSPEKSNRSTYLSPLRETNRLNQSLSKSVNRSIDLNSSGFRDSGIQGGNQNSSSGFSQSFINRNKFNTYEEELFVEYLREVLVNEREAEKVKCLLSMRTDFNLRDLFKIFQFNNFTYLNASDIKLGFNLFNVYPTNEEVELLIKRYDGTSVLSNFGFNDMVLPVDTEYSSMMKGRIPYDFHLKYGPEIFSFETRFCIENLFKALVNTEVSAEAWREKFYLLKTFDARLVFDKIDYYAKNYLSNEDVSSILNLVHKELQDQLNPL
jgi:Ca2+-binding EF-hand superfamily protein